MPLFEYECRGCHQQFEFLTRDGQSPSCPSCKGEDLQKLLSSFAVSTGGSAKSFCAPTAGGCGGCGDMRDPGSCPMMN
jgi:putative FmdB family regulatory protein